jgi:hypothetical protein
MNWLDKDDNTWSIDIIDRELATAIFQHGIDERAIELGIRLKAIMVYGR